MEGNDWRERSGFEAGSGFRRSPRQKNGLETPLRASFYGEKLIVIAPPLWYDILVLACLSGGFGFSVYAFFQGGVQIGNMPFLGFFLGLAVGVAGIWGALSNERMSCDVVKRTYARLEGQGIGKRLTRGSLDELDALVAMAERYMGGLSGTVVYRLVLHWKGQAQPLLVIENQYVTLAPGAAINAKSGEILWLGSRIAAALKVPFYDNTYFHSPGPVKV